MAARTPDSPPVLPMLVMAAALAAPVVVGLTMKSEGVPLPPSAMVSAGGSASAKAASTGSAKAAAGPVEIDADLLAAFAPLPSVMESKDNPITEEKVKLGRMLYFEKRLSKNHDISCNSCHDLASFGDDGKDFSDGHKGQKGGRNAPTVYNAALHTKQFWDGRAATVEEQAGGPILNPGEMAMKDEKAVLDTLKSMPEYVDAFKAAFPDDKDPVTYDNLKKAIGAFERKLVTPSAWDKFLAGDKKALSDEQKRGFVAFVDAGCTACHNGAGVGGGSFQKLGAVKPWPNQKDQGKFEVTKSDDDKMQFKVASLRNAEHTAPYFHDSSAKSLDEAIKLMGRHQLGKELTADQVGPIVAWIKALSGTVPTEYVKEPELPKSTKKTPKADPS